MVAFVGEEPELGVGAGLVPISNGSDATRVIVGVEQFVHGTGCNVDILNPVALIVERVGRESRSERGTADLAGSVVLDILGQYSRLRRGRGRAGNLIAAACGERRSEDAREYW